MLCLGLLLEASLLVPSMPPSWACRGGVQVGSLAKSKAQLFPEALQRCNVEGLSLGAPYNTAGWPERGSTFEAPS